MLSLKINNDYTIDGDSLSFSVARHTGLNNSALKTSSNDACAKDLIRAKDSFYRLCPGVNADLERLVAVDQQINAKITALVKNKLITRVDLEHEFFLCFERGDICLERVRPQRTDKSKNLGFWGNWHLHLAVIHYKNVLFAHSPDTVVTIDDGIAMLNSIYDGIVASFSKVQLIDQGEPAINPAREISYVKFEATAEKSKMRVR